MFIEQRSCETRSFPVHPQVDVIVQPSLSCHSALSSGFSVFALIICEQDTASDGLRTPITLIGSILSLKVVESVRFGNVVVEVEVTCGRVMDVAEDNPTRGSPVMVPAVVGRGRGGTMPESEKLWKPLASWLVWNWIGCLWT